MPTDFPSLHLRNVRQGGTRSLAAVAGVCLALSMVLLQLGFLQAVRFTATNIYDQLDFDVALLAPNYEQFFDTSSFPRQRLRQVEAFPEVLSASPLYVTMGIWRCPPDRVPASGSDNWLGSVKRWWQPPRKLQMRELLVCGVDLETRPFRDTIQSCIDHNQQALKADDHLLMNELSNPDFGWQKREEFSEWELNSQGVTIVGSFPLLRSFGADASVICSDRNFARLCQWDIENANIGLVKIEKGSPDSVAQMLNTHLPEDVRAVTREELRQREEDHWVRNTATGEIFGFGVFVSMIVAGVVIFQVLSSDIRNHLPEYATMKAMGYSNAFLARIVAKQSLVYCLAAYLLSVPIGMVTYWATEHFAAVPMQMTAYNLLFVFVLTLFVGMVSARISIAKVYSTSPANLF